MQPLTPGQVAGNIRATLDIQDYHKRKNPIIYDAQWANPGRPRDHLDELAQLYEHNECTRWGSNSTACPSERLRYAWPKIVAALNKAEEDVAADERLDQIFMKMDGSGDPVMFTVLDGNEPTGRKSISLSRLDFINYRAMNFMVEDVAISTAWRDFIQSLTHTEKHGHVIEP